jgi:hypothetical protein
MWAAGAASVGVISAVAAQLGMRVDRGREGPVAWTKDAVGTVIGSEFQTQPKIKKQSGKGGEQ